MKLSNQSKNFFLAIHLIFIITWSGGVVSCLPLLFHLNVNDYNEALYTYLHIKTIAHNVIGWGGIGSFITGLFLAIFTSWGIWKHKWVKAKLILAIALIAFGMLFNENRISANIELLQNQPDTVLQSTEFLTNYVTLKIGMVSSCALFLITLFIAIFKPWMRRDTSWRFTG